MKDQYKYDQWSLVCEGQRSLGESSRGLCYLPTRRLSLGHLGRSRKHLNTWNTYKMLSCLRTRNLSPRSRTENLDSFSIQFPVAGVLWGQPSLWVPAPLQYRLDSSLTRLPSNQPLAKAQAPLTPPPGSRERRGWARWEPPAPLSPAPSGIIRPAAALPHVGGAGAPRHCLLMNNADSGGVPDPEVELPSHRSG